MNLDLLNKVFIISGSSRGIGKGIAQVLLQEGACVALTGRDKDCLAATYDEMRRDFPGKIIQQPGDINKGSLLLKLERLILGKWSKIDGLVANAGAVKPPEELEISWEDWEWYFKANLKVAIRFVSHFTPQLRKTKGSIVFISSIAGVEDIGAPLPYSSSKAALTMYAKGLSRRLSYDSIRVNTIAPGNILFPDGNWERKVKKNPDDIQRMLKDKVPMRKFGTTEDIGNVAAFLLSNRASFITGSCIVVDGGQTHSCL